MDLRDLDARALESTGAFVAATSLDQLGQPTPCAGWDVRALLNHIIGGNLLFGAAAAGEPSAWSTREEDRTGAAPAAAYHRSASTVTERFAALDLGADQLQLPFGLIPAARAVAIHFVDVLTHGWDLATATGQDPTLDPDLATAALEIVAQYPPELWGNPVFFGDKVLAPADAPPHVRLVALLGRQI